MFWMCFLPSWKECGIFHVGLDKRIYAGIPDQKAVAANYVIRQAALRPVVSPMHQGARSAGQGKTGVNLTTLSRHSGHQGVLLSRYADPAGFISDEKTFQLTLKRHLELNMLFSIQCPAVSG